MASLGLKIFYLRTREKRLSQQQIADALDVRQATLSHIEQSRSLPNCALLRSLCEFFDVTPSFLLDEERGVVPKPTERWSVRNGLVTTGMWIEVPEERIEITGNGRAIVPLLPGESFFDAEGAEARRGRAAATTPDAAPQEAEAELVQRLEYELAEHPRRRHIPAPE